MSETFSGAEEEEWQSRTSVDYLVLGFVGTFQAVALLICVHLLWYRKWPPYLTKNVNLVVIATISGVLWTGATTISSGMWERQADDVLAACDFERFLSWCTLCVHTVTFFIRVYRMWRILIKHDKHMWHTEHQIVLMSSVSLIPVIITWIMPDTGFFDERLNTCATVGASSLVTVGMDCIGLAAIAFLWFVCARQLKVVRLQFNEHDTMKKTLLYMTIVLLSYPVIVLYLLADDHVMERRVTIFYPLLTTYILLWGSIREPFIKKLLGDEEYLLSYTKGFSSLPSPAQLKASLAEQLSVDQLRSEFRRYIKTKVAQELIDFYLESLDREEVMGFFERQAVTMRIVEQYIREGAPEQVNISEECRERVLATDVTAYDIFDEARAEVLVVMETNFRREFVTSEGFRRILDASEQEEREIRFLRAGGMLLPGSPPTRLSSSSLSSGQRHASGRVLPSLTAGFKNLPIFSVLFGRRRKQKQWGMHDGEGGSARVAAIDVSLPDRERLADSAVAGPRESAGRSNSASGSFQGDRPRHSSGSISGFMGHSRHRLHRSPSGHRSGSRTRSSSSSSALSRALARRAEITGLSHTNVEMVDAVGSGIDIERGRWSTSPQMEDRAALRDRLDDDIPREKSTLPVEELVDAWGASNGSIRNDEEHGLDSSGVISESHEEPARQGELMHSVMVEDTQDRTNEPNTVMINPLHAGYETSMSNLDGEQHTERREPAVGSE